MADITMEQFLCEYYKEGAKVLIDAKRLQGIVKELEEKKKDIGKLLSNLSVANMKISMMEMSIERLESEKTIRVDTVV